MPPERRAPEYVTAERRRVLEQCVHAEEAAERVAEVGRVSGVDRVIRGDPRHQVVTEEGQELVSAAVIVFLGEQGCVAAVDASA